MGNVTNAISKAQTAMKHVHQAEQIVDTGKQLLGKQQDKKQESKTNENLNTVDPSSIPNINKNDLGIDLNKFI